MNRNRAWVGLIGIWLVLACVCSAAGIWGIVRLAQRTESGTLAEQPVAGRSSAQVNGRIAYVGTDGNIYTLLPDGSGLQSVTQDGPAAAERFNMLAWSPDGQLAFVSATEQGSALFTAHADGSARTQVYAGEPDAIPFYLYWSPDGNRLAFLTTARSGRTALWLAESQEADSAKTIERGSPYYFSWSPDSRSLLMHIGGSRTVSPEAHVSIFQPDSSATQELADAPGEFQTPAWSPDGKRFLFVRQTEQQGDELVLAEGDSRRVLASSRSGLIFTASPRDAATRRNRIALAAFDPGNMLVYNSINVMDADSLARRPVAQGDIVSFFWSPDGERLAVLDVDSSKQGPQGRALPINWPSRSDAQQNRVQLTWSVINVADGTSVDFPSFRPTDSFLSIIPYFDQYAQSLSLWSPDGRYLTFADVDDQGKTFVCVLDTTRPGQPVQRLTEGTFSAWSWR